MVGLVGVTGYAGVGKTTAAKRLSTITTGWYLYLGQTVLDEVRARKLAGTPHDERQVRIDLRQTNGPAAFAMPYVERVAELVGRGIPVFVDAIFTQAEFDVLASHVSSGSARLLAIEASFDIRKARLACRSERPFSVDELRERDETERTRFRTDAIIAAAKYKIRNEGTLEEFHQALAEFVTSCA